MRNPYPTHSVVVDFSKVAGNKLIDCVTESRQRKGQSNQLIIWLKLWASKKEADENCKDNKNAPSDAIRATKPQKTFDFIDWKYET